MIRWWIVFLIWAVYGLWARCFLGGPRIVKGECANYGEAAVSDQGTLASTWRCPRRRSAIRPGSRGSSSAGSRINLKATDPWTLVDGDQPSSGTERSVASSSSGMSLPSTSDCFLENTLFETPEGRFVPAALLKKGSQVRGSEFSILTVRAIDFCPQLDDGAGFHDVVYLSTAGANLVVTATHKIMIPRGAQQQTIDARSLTEGDDIIVSGSGVEREKLVKVASGTVQTRVAQIKFEPNKAVRAFHPPDTQILSKGYVRPKTRRGPLHSDTDTDSDRYLWKDLRTRSE